MRSGRSAQGLPTKDKGPQLFDERVRATEVRLIHDERNEVVPRAEAERLAEETGLDLLIVSLESSPPVVRLIDYGKFKYEAEKKTREARKKQHVIEVKEVKMGVRIDDNDYNIKVRRGIHFLEEGNKVKLTLRLKGREVQHSNLAFALASKFVQELEPYGVVESSVRQEGRAFSAQISPKPGAAAKKSVKEKEDSDAEAENA